MPDFELAVKSTLDHVGSQLAASVGISEFVDIDDTVKSEDALTGTSPAVIWRFLSMDEDPRDPLFSLSFLIGVKTTSDPDNYSLLGFVSKVKKAFEVGSDLVVMDWSQDTEPVTALGRIYFTESGVDHQVMDRLSGVRMLTVEARVTRLLT